MNNQEIDALITIYKDSRGYINDLHKKIGERLTNEFISVGFISCGYTRFNKTWHITKFGQSYIEEIRLINNYF